MGEWLTYRPHDLLLFSEEVYWRLFELHNEAWWPLPVLALFVASGVAVHAAWPRAWSGRFIGIVLAGAWGFVAWAFLWQRYAPINWAAAYVAPAFVLEALLLLGAGLAGQPLFTERPRAGRTIGLAIFAYALALHPLVAVVSGRPLWGADVFGLAPDATAMATLGLLAAAERSAVTWILGIVPALWCLASFATLHTIGTWEGWIPLAALALAIGARLLPEPAPPFRA